jgi:hypothetical protein
MTQTEQVNQLNTHSHPDYMNKFVLSHLLWCLVTYPKSEKVCHFPEHGHSLEMSQMVTGIPHCEEAGLEVPWNIRTYQAIVPN